MNRRRLQTRLVPAAGIIGMVLIASAIGFHILREQRLRLPWDDRYAIKAELSSGQALTPGQGQSVTVAGVEVGEVARVTLKDGRALVEMSIERGALPEVRRDATLFVRPRTPLQDMTIDVNPGTPEAGALSADDVIPLSRTTPQVNLDEILAALDTDTRDYAIALVGGFADGIHDRSTALRNALKASAPTLRLSRRVATVTADRRRQLARAIHSLRSLTAAVAGEETSLGTLVTAGDTTFSTLAAEDDALRTGLERLPGTLRAAREALAAAEPFSREAAPAFERLVPVARRLPGTLRSLDPLRRDALPALEALNAAAPGTRSLARSLTPAARDLTTVNPELETALGSLERLGDVLAYNPPGKEEGYLFWMAWFLHNGHNFISGQDGNGPFWRGIVQFSCSTAFSEPLTGAILKPVLEITKACPGPPPVAAKRTRKVGGR